MALKRVLVAVEDDYFCREIADYLKQHNWSEDVQFLVMHAVRPARVFEDSQATSKKLTEIAEKYGDKLVNHVAKLIRKTIEPCVVETRVVKGKPKNEIINTARDWKADLIILGAHGHEKEDTFRIGSISAMVSTYAPCSVLIVRWRHGQKKE